MLNVAREKNVYKNLYTAFLGPYPIKGIERGEHETHCFIKYENLTYKQREIYVVSCIVLSMQTKHAKF